MTQSLVAEPRYDLWRVTIPLCREQRRVLVQVLSPLLLCPSAPSSPQACEKCGKRHSYFCLQLAVSSTL